MGRHDKDHLEVLGVYGRIILKWIFKQWDGEEWTGIAVAHNMDRWQALVNTVMNLRVPHKWGNFLTSQGPVSFSRRTLLHAANVIDSSGLG